MGGRAPGAPPPRSANASIWIQSILANVDLHWNWLSSQLFPIYFHLKLYSNVNGANFVYYGKTRPIILALLAKSKNKTKAGADPEFPWGGGTTYYSAKFSPKLHGNEEIWVERGEHVSKILLGRIATGKNISIRYREKHNYGKNPFCSHIYFIRTRQNSITMWFALEPEKSLAIITTIQTKQFSEALKDMSTICCSSMFWELIKLEVMLRWYIRY